MKHHEYSEYIRSRTDLGPDQKSISIQHDLDRRKGTSTHSANAPESKDTTEPEKPTVGEFEPVERFEYNGTNFVAGEAGGSFWVAYSGSEELDERIFEGPADSLEEAIEDAKATEDIFDELDKELGIR